MKYSRVINRPMFNKHNSAYGRGIASNLVTEEQRQRFNSGGRVKLQFGSSGWHIPTATAGAAGTAAAVGSKINLPALYKPGWWQSIKNIGSKGVGHATRLGSALVGSGTAGATLPLAATVGVGIAAQKSAQAKRKKGEYLPGGELIEESETEEFQPGKPIEIDGKKYRADKWGGVDELSFSEQELAGSDLDLSKIGAEKDEKGNIKSHLDADGNVVRHTAK